MKKKDYKNNNKKPRNNHIPLRYIFAMLIIIFEILSIFGIVIALTIYLPYFYIVVVLTQLICAVGIINSKDNPDYKVPWLFFVIIIPILGFMTYFMFYSRNLSKKQTKKFKKLTNTTTIEKDDSIELMLCKEQNYFAYSQANLLSKLSISHLYQNTDIRFLVSGEEYYYNLINDLKTAKSFIFMEYFIIQEGEFWNSILDILKQKVKEGVEVRIVYDDIGCMRKLTGRYYKILWKMGIKSIPFSILKGQANNQFNNRSHRKITVVDGKIGYTGGINLADEYINKVQPFGHWKDAGIRLEGEAVNELTRLFLIDYEISVKKPDFNFEKYYINHKILHSGFCIPFGDGPKPMYERRVSKTIILNMLNQAQNYVYITTPYLIIDNELVSAIENAALRGIDVRIITPHIPDKKIVFSISRRYYDRLIDAGVRIYEYTPGFIHAKIYLSDDKFAIVGTINLDYRSLVHHFENGVWIYNHEVIKEIKKDYIQTLKKSFEFDKGSIKKYGLLSRFIISFVCIFSPLL